MPPFQQTCTTARPDRPVATKNDHVLSGTTFYPDERHAAVPDRSQQSRAVPLRRRQTRISRWFRLPSPGSSFPETPVSTGPEMTVDGDSDRCFFLSFPFLVPPYRPRSVGSIVGGARSRKFYFGVNSGVNSAVKSGVQSVRAGRTPVRVGAHRSDFLPSVSRRDCSDASSRCSGR
jgi:hypothetical protein